MVNTVLVSVICNLVAALVLLGCLFSTNRNSLKVSLVRFILMVGCGAGCYFAAPELANVICDISVKETTIGQILAEIMSAASINSIIFTALFLLGYGFNAIVCNIVRTSLVNKYKSKTENSARIKRAKSINHKAEKLAKKAEKRELNRHYKENNRGFRKVLAFILNMIIGLVLGFILLMPFGYIAEDFKSEDKEFLHKGFDYTLNGLVDEKIDFKVFDWLISSGEFAE